MPHLQKPAFLTESRIHTKEKTASSVGDAG